VNSADLSPDEKLLVTAGNNGTARVWDLATGEPAAILRGHRGEVAQPRASPRYSVRRTPRGQARNNTVLQRPRGRFQSGSTPLEETNISKLLNITVGGFLVDQCEELDDGDEGERVYDKVMHRRQMGIRGRGRPRLLLRGPICGTLVSPERRSQGHARRAVRGLAAFLDAWYRPSRRSAVQPDAPGSGGVGSSANQFSVPVVEEDGTLDVGFVSENCNDSVDPHLLFQKSTDGGQTFLPSAVQIDKPGQYADFQDAGNDDTIPPTHFRAPNTPSLAYSPRTGTLLYVYQNNVNRPASQADISYQTSTDGGLHWSDAAFLSTDTSSQPAPNDQFFPWAASDENGRFYVIWFDRRLDPANVRINTWQSVSSNDAASFASAKISSSDWDPNLGFFTSGAFIGDYNGLAASTEAVYAVWTDGRDDVIGQTGLGETDIFTKFQKNP
jgi:hypothetical protein